MSSKENNSLHQAFQYLSVSANNIFSRKSKNIISSEDIAHNNKEPKLLNKINDSHLSIIEDFSPCTTRSNSNITIHSLLSQDDDLLSPIPTPSTSKDIIEEEPWRLLHDGNIYHDDYFFMDRQDLQHTTVNKDSMIER
jgi:hypothetical protein